MSEVLDQLLVPAVSRATSTSLLDRVVRADQGLALLPARRTSFSAAR